MLAMVLVVAISLPYVVSAFEVHSFPSSLEELYFQIENDEVVIRYVPNVGFYLTHEIEQGLEFTILGKDAFNLERSSFIRNYLQVDVTNVGVMPAPDTVINTTHNGRTIIGMFWGGIFAVGGTSVSHVGSAVNAASSNSRGRASVVPGNNANVVRSLWQNAGTVAQISAPNSLFGGNRSYWDMESR